MTTRTVLFSSLMLADADGSDPRLLVEGDQIESPRWSSDGTRIAYSEADGIHLEAPENLAAAA